MTAHYPHATISKLFARPRRIVRRGLTCYQRDVLRWLDERGDGAVRVGGAWVWPVDVRRDPSLAERIYWTIVN